MMDIIGLGDAAGKIGDAAAKIVGMLAGDKSAEERDKAALQVQQVVAEAANDTAQIAVDMAEAQSPDRLNHWRGALGWVVAIGVGWHYVVLRLLAYITAIVVAFLQARGYSAVLPEMPDLSKEELSTLWELAAVMLGSHAVPHIAGAFKRE